MNLFSGIGIKYLFLSLILLACYLVAWPKESDCAAYRTFAEHSRDLTRASSPIHQKRSTVCKEIWFSDEGQIRLHYRIESAGSSLTLQPREKRIDVIEHLDDMCCWMQDKLFIAPSGQDFTQQTRYFAAKEGTYHFLTQNLMAQQATLSLYRIPGDALPEQGLMPTSPPFLSGQAETVALSVAGHTPSFQAHEFKAIFTKTN